MKPTLTLLTALLLAPLATLHSASGPKPQLQPAVPATQYVLFNRAPGQGMYQAIPESLGREQFDEVLAHFPNRAGARLQTGVSYIFSPFRTPPETTVKAPRTFLDAAGRELERADADGPQAGLVLALPVADPTIQTFAARFFANCRYGGFSGLTSPKITPRDPALLQPWLRWVNEPQTDAELQALRKCLRRSYPFGDDGWATRSTARLDLPSAVRPRGRPDPWYVPDDVPLPNPAVFQVQLVKIGAP